MAKKSTTKVFSSPPKQLIKENKQGKNYLLVIAINEYQHCKPLRNTVKDAKDFIEILTTKYQFEKENLYILFDGEATRKNILTQFKELKKLVKAENKDNLIIYFSGHGEQEDNIGYWIPTGAKIGEEDEYISTSEIADRVSALPTLHTYLIVDACFSGALFANYKNTRPKANYEKKSSRWGLAASHTRELAYDGKPGENSPFAKYLLQKLKEHDGSLTSHELNAYVVKEVEANTKPKQTPIAQPLLVEGNEGGQFVFHPKTNEAEEWKLAVEKNTILTYQDFKKRYPESELIEEADWKITLLKNTVRSFSAFVRNYSSSIYRSEALNKIEELEEEKDWQTALKRNKISAFLRYLGDYPNGKQSKEAKEKIKALEAKEEPQPIQKVDETPPASEPKEEKKDAPRLKVLGKIDLASQLKSRQEKSKPEPKQEIDDLIFIDETLPASEPKEEAKEEKKDAPRLKVLGKIDLASQLKSRQEKSKPEPKQEIDDLIFIKGGSFEMGEVFDYVLKDTPPHIVSVPDFYLAPHTVTFDEYDEYCEATNREKPSDGKWGREKRPVINVSWYDALEYCNWKSKANNLPPVYTLKGVGPKVKVNWQGKGYRLPTEAEWEYAAREGGKKVRFGNGKNRAFPNEINFERGHGKRLPIGFYQPNMLGLYEMSGNVWEWCWDAYSKDYYYKSRGLHYPKGPNFGNIRVIRGGCCFSDVNNCKASFRNWFEYGDRDNSISFRIARYSVK